MSELKFRFDRVMVIDDNSIDLFIAAKLMRKHQFSQTVIAYESAETALEFLREKQNDIEALPEIIFVDIYMAVMSGFQFLDAYENLSVALKKHCRVYVVSSSIDEYDIRRVDENIHVVGFGTKTLTADFLNSIKVR